MNSLQHMVLTPFLFESCQNITEVGKNHKPPCFNILILMTKALFHCRRSNPLMPTQILPGNFKHFHYWHN